MKKLTPVFTISLTIALAFIIWGAFAPNNLESITGSIQSFITDQFGWFYLLAATGFLGFAIFLIFSPYGRIKLGKDEDKPDYNYLTWFSFLFTAGMGIGLVFWGVAEPIYHLYDPSPAANVEGGTIGAAGSALRYSFFHWGFHPWAIYSIVGLTLAYFKFRKGAPGVLSATFQPLIGDKINGGIGTTINVIVVFATIFGVATSLGFGTAQIGGGLSNIFGFENTFFLQLMIIVVVTFLYMLSSQTGLNKGIRILSKANIYLAMALMLFLLFSGPTNFIMNSFTQTLGNYVQNLVSMSFQLDTFNIESTWVEGWTIFYWAWWIAWAPFVGTFIARVSKGRTIREFVLGVIAVPTIFGALWFSIFGGTAINLETLQGISVMEVMSESGEESALFFVLQQFNFGWLLSIIAIFLIASFFITSADSATFVLGMQTTNGSLNPPNNVKLVWGIVQSSTAAILLYSGGLNALQTASIIAAFPFAIIMIFMIISLVKALRREVLPQRYKFKKEH
ncbi:BCCT family transporter [Salipaludibacillus agaradhaerens]|uniref:glycine betaine uptake BCCT transporter n=1 Tax=Salipaludibacillus agaradhaerens TaxID=76935 RepID=UPI0009965237|nr:BCCT family transporter [Salipaludibacillus agaradhaerens]MCR6107225.1 BCCT family transporter [Salipaludibacillus agaradhaerens]MCR6119254.1 BCCT family transporter [Salipaludibacillus agaradhaerens]UJW58294.1 BCCT family transporter [Bacillus sp. A116_S68]